jgi:hypothetical protein
MFLYHILFMFANILQDFKAVAVSITGMALDFTATALNTAGMALGITAVA